MSDERREVAARLRFFARETNGTSDFSMYLGHWVNADEEQVGNPFTVQANRKSAERTLEKLADLIDPQERTCENVSEKDFEFACSNCHAYTDSPNSYRVEIGYKSGLHNNLNYCPYCGARVTDGGDSR